MARFYLDECVPLPLVQLLAQHGHDVTAAMQLGLRGLNDPFHLKYATDQNWMWGPTTGWHADKW